MKQIPIQLPVTLVAIDGTSLTRILTAVTISRQLTGYDAVKILTPFECDDPDHERIPPMDYEGYNRFVVKDLVRYCAGSHLLLTQDDGFVLNPSAWTDEFLEYDYIGAPWWHVNNMVGNGGFSLRSKRFLEATAALECPRYVPEDVLVCQTNRDRFEAQGLRYAPFELACRFAVENAAWQGQLGFHGSGTDISAWMNDPAHAGARDLIVATHGTRLNYTLTGETT